MPNGNSDQEGVTIVDGSLDFSAGVNSYLTPTVASDRNPNGLKRNQLAWLNNATVRGGGITQRPAWQKIGDYPAGASGVYQGKFIYEPDSELPYQIVAVGGHIWRMDVDDPASAIDLSLTIEQIPDSQTVTGQVGLILQQTIGPAGMIAGSTTALFGNYRTFYTHGAGIQTFVPLEKIYTGVVFPDPAATFTSGAFTWDVIASVGWIANPHIDRLTTLPSDLARYYFCQAEQFLVIQAGDLETLPLIWDGTILRRSVGLDGSGGPPSSNGYGTLVAISSASFLMQGFNTNMTIPTTTTYAGAVDDQLSLLTGPVTTGSGIGATLDTFSYAGATMQVMSIAANSITVRVIGNQSPYLPATVVGANTPIFRLNFVSLNPSSGISSGQATPEIPPATAMDYFMGRLWYAQGRKYSAGDIVGNQSSGTQAYDFRDSVLKITENPLAVGGDGFTVPTNAGNIRAIKHSANINTTLGEGQLYIFTRRSVYSLSVPVTRTDWIGADTNNSPRQTVVQITNGSVNDRSIVEQNGDLFFQSFEPSIRSLVLAMRYYEQWGNTPISINENRILKFNDRALMQFSAGVGFDNRVLELVLPELSPFGVIHRGVIPLNFDVVSTLETKLPPVWEGAWEGLSFLELAAGDFGGRQRCFATIYSDKDNNLQLWEISNADRFEKGDNRVEWFIEFPAFTWGNEFEMKKLVSAEIWIDRLFGEVMFQMEYRPDGDACWRKWHTWKQCTARTSCEDVRNPNCTYPTDYCESFRETMILPKPPASCVRPSGRPSNYGFQFQTRLIIKGFCRVRGLLLKAERVQQQLYGKDLVC